MNKIVSKGLIMDLHIHSEHSKHKDKGKEGIKQNTIKNIDILVEKLNYNKVNICAISDHDYFSYELFSRLREEEGKGSIKKVLPAVEFSVTLKRQGVEKQIHIVTIFDDSDLVKVENIEKILKFNNNKKPDYNKGESFSEHRFIDILSEIGLNTLCIAHQKNTLSSNSKPLKNDALSLGEDTFNEFLFSEYFESFEFKNRRNEIFNNISKSKMSKDLLRFVTGSDCHDWSVYPKYDSNEKEDNFKFTYIKCLPTFRGVSLALTEDSRISLDDNFFNQSNKILETLDLSIGEEKFVIPLSRGINVIIGDNSIGKSLLLHKITNYYREGDKKKLSALTTKIKNGYEQYLSKNNIDINTIIDIEDIFEFDTQGEIRKKFNFELLDEESFFKDKYPPDINTITIKSLITSKVNSFIEMLENRFEYDEQITNLENIIIQDLLVDASSLTVVKSQDNDYKKENTRVDNIVGRLTRLILEYNELIKLINIKIEKDYLTKALKELETLKNKYMLYKINNENQLKIINSLNIAFDNYETEYSKIKTSNDITIENYSYSKSNLVENLMSTLKAYKGKTTFNYVLGENNLLPKSFSYLNYSFVKKTKVMKFDTKYFNELLKKPLNANYNINFNEMDKEKLIEVLKQYQDVDPLVFYKNKLIEQLNDDISSVESIIEKKDDIDKEYSDGLNVRIYFNILSTFNKKNGIYLIDQPEDDVSPKSIKDHILNDFKRMSNSRQIIMVTHNPQFVVNLDVDNVIHISRDPENNIKIESGALEYECNEYKILENVAHSLEGGVETIKKRWKRYDKNIYN